MDCRVDTVADFLSQTVRLLSVKSGSRDITAKGHNTNNLMATYSVKEKEIVISIILLIRYLC